MLIQMSNFHQKSMFFLSDQKQHVTDALIIFEKSSVQNAYTTERDLKESFKQTYHALLT